MVKMRGKSSPSPCFDFQYSDPHVKSYGVRIARYEMQCVAVTLAVSKGRVISVRDGVFNGQRRVSVITCNRRFTPYKQASLSITSRKMASISAHSCAMTCNSTSLPAYCRLTIGPSRKAKMHGCRWALTCRCLPSRKLQPKSTPPPL